MYCQETCSPFRLMLSSPSQPGLALSAFFIECKKECIQLAVTDGGQDSSLSISGALLLSHSSGMVCPFCSYLAAYVGTSVAALTAQDVIHCLQVLLREGVLGGPPFPGWPATGRFCHRGCGKTQCDNSTWQGGSPAAATAAAAAAACKGSRGPGGPGPWKAAAPAAVCGHCREGPPVQKGGQRPAGALRVARTHGNLLGVCCVAVKNSNRVERFVDKRDLKVSVGQ